MAWVMWIVAAWAGEGVVAYNDRLLLVTMKMVNQTTQLQAAAAPRSPEDIEPFRLSLRTIALGFAEETRALPPFLGDAGFRDALAEQAAVIVGLIDHPVRDFAEITLRSPPHSADVADADRAYAAILDGAAASDERVRAAQRDFAARHRLTLTPATPPPALDEGPPFACPEIIPAGMRLPAEWVGGRTVAYVNGFVEDSNEVVGAFNDVIAASGGAGGLEAVRRSSLARIEKVSERSRQRGDWLGDNTLAHGIKAFEEECKNILETTVAKLAKVEGRGLRNQADIEVYNQHIETLNERFPLAMAGWGSATTVFSSHWHLDEYAAWQAEYSVWADAQRPLAVPPPAERAPTPNAQPAP